MHPHGSKLLRGIFIGYHQQAGGYWSKDYMIVDWEDMHQATHISQVTVRRINSKQVFPQISDDGNWTFPCPTGELFQPMPMGENSLSDTHRRNRTGSISARPIPWKTNVDVDLQPRDNEEKETATTGEDMTYPLRQESGSGYNYVDQDWPTFGR